VGHDRSGSGRVCGDTAGRGRDAYLFLPGWSAVQLIEQAGWKSLIRQGVAKSASEAKGAGTGTI